MAVPVGPGAQGTRGTLLGLMLGLVLFLGLSLLQPELAAFLPRLVLAAAAGSLVEVQGLNLIGALLLAIIAVNLVAPDGRAGKAHAVTDNGTAGQADGVAASLWAAGMAIAIVNLVMSFDNTVAPAAVSQGSAFYLALGLAFSIPVLTFGNIALVALFRHHPGLVVVGGAMLGWSAGDMAVSDPLVLPWIYEQAPALSIVVPLLAAVYVLAQARIEAQAPAAADTVAPAAGLAVPATVRPRPIRTSPRRVQAADGQAKSARAVALGFTALFMVVYTLLVIGVVFGEVAH